MLYSDFLGTGGLATPTGGTEGTAYLMNLIGPLATTANQVAPPVTVSGLAGSFAPRTLFTGLTLPPGNYYLMTVSARNQPGNLSMSPQGNNSIVITPGFGIADLGSRVTSSVAAYPPYSSGLTPLFPPGTIALTVTGDLAPSGAPTPAPTSWILIVTGLMAAGLYGVCRKFARRGA